MRWLSVDVPEAIGVRARFLPETGRFRHLAVSALDPAWMDAVDPSGGVLVLAQGLLMYFEPEDVTHLLGGIAHRFPGAEIVFDTVPVWFSRLTLKGLNRTPDYRLPPMPWGIDRDRIVPTMRAWVPAMNVEILPLPMSRGLARVIDQVFGVVPWLRHKRPGLVCCRVGL